MGQAERHELEMKIEEEKARFFEASKQAIDTVLADLSPVRWIESYPWTSATVIAVAGFALGYALPEEAKKPTVEEEGVDSLVSIEQSS